MGVPTPHSPGAGGVLPMRRVQSDQTPSLNDSDGRDNDNAYCVQMMVSRIGFCCAKRFLYIVLCGVFVV